MPKSPLYPIAALLLGATLWGLIWYPYRLLESAGVGGAMATLCGYLVTLAIGSVIFRSAWRGFRQAPLLLAITGLAAGWSIVSYVIAVVDGEVMRVLLLFYLSPLWTVPLARIVLNERVPAMGYAVLALALAGAAIMLWQPGLGVPWPASASEWLGLSSGVTFALANVLVRKLQACSIETKSLAIWLGSVLLAAAALWLSDAPRASALQAISAAWPLILLVGVVSLVMSLVIQYGFTHTPANQAIVIMLFELVVGALSAYMLAGERMQVREWVGGLLIVAAGLWSDRLVAATPQVRRATGA